MDVCDYPAGVIIPHIYIRLTFSRYNSNLIRFAIMIIKVFKSIKGMGYQLAMLFYENKIIGIKPRFDNGLPNHPFLIAEKSRVKFARPAIHIIFH